MSASLHRVAINPLPWIFGSDFSWNMNETTIRGALTELQHVGFTALHAEIPEGMTVPAYRALLTEFGFEPAPGYYGADFDDAQRLAAVVEGARVAAAAQAELGLSEMFVANELPQARRDQPAIGAAFDRHRLDQVTEGLVAAADAMAAEGVTAALHPHVGSWVEVEHEIRSVLDATTGTSLAFGPDTGHLFWAGADPAELIRDYADRVVALHLKDVDAAVRTETISSGADYAESTFGRHIWTEPGRGSIDFDAVFAALPQGFAGWFVIEVDVPNLPDRVQSARASFDWVAQRPELSGVVA